MTWITIKIFIDLNYLEQSTQHGCSTMASLGRMIIPFHLPPIAVMMNANGLQAKTADTLHGILVDTTVKEQDLGWKIRQPNNRSSHPSDMIERSKYFD